MSHTSKIFEEAPVKVQNRNGFDLSHLNVGTAKTGQLVPVMCKLLPPNSKFTLGVNVEVNLPPLAAPFYGRIDAIVEGFVIPCSILYAGWKQFIMNQQETGFPANQSQVAVDGGYLLPKFPSTAVSVNDVASFRTLMGTNDNIYEYLGMRESAASQSAWAEIYLSMLPGLAYHLIVDKWYRNKQITKTWFAVNPNWEYTSSVSGASGLFMGSKNVSLIWHSFYNSVEYGYTGNSGSTTIHSGSNIFSSATELTFPDGTSFFSTRQRNYSRDYFTAATPDPQQGNPSALQFSVDLSTGDGEFTISTLRAANALQKFLETNNLSADYAQQMRNRWGTKPIDADFDEPYYLGRVVLPVYQKSVVQTGAAWDSTSTDAPAGADSSNPFVRGGQLGAKGAAGGFSGGGSIADSFVNSTWSYVMCLFSLVPHAMYGYGLNRELTMLELGDFPAPELQTVGNEAIKSYELYWDGSALSNDFGYIPRYSRFKYMDDEVHGEMRPNRTLDMFVLQRRLNFSGNAPQLSTSFLQIPQDALDAVFAVSTASMNLSCWYEIFFEFKVSMPLADFCIPTLGDIQDTHTQHTPIGGSKL